MAVEKNFVVKNGLEVSTDLVFANASQNKVGIATTTLTHTLTVNGAIGAEEINITGVTTANNLVIQGTLTANTSTGSTGNYLVSTGVGVTWVSPRTSTVGIATNGQTTFNVNYTVGSVDVYINGIRLISPPSGYAEFTASNGTSIVLNDACFGDEIVEIVVYS